MIFHESDFIQYLGTENARLAAKMANERIGKTGVVIYGNHYSDGSCSNFSSKQADHDTHVGIVIGLATMGSLPILDKSFDLNKITEEDIVKAQAEQIERLESELKQVRGKK